MQIFPRFKSLIVILVLSLCTLGSAAQEASKQVVMVPMRDGIKWGQIFISRKARARGR
jgi:hypothetical protein